MKIKHLYGYGTVNAKKVSSKTVKDAFGLKWRELIVEVYGNHEQGLETYSKLDAFNWLVKKFDKSITEYTQISDMITKTAYIKENGIDVEHCEYKFIIYLGQ